MNRELLELGSECASAITGMPEDIQTEEAALAAIQHELELGRKAYHELRKLEYELSKLAKPRKVL